MKFNKEKTKKFASGGKSPKEIMEEARRNQLIERQAQARDKVKTSGIAAYQSTPVTIQAPRQEVVKEYAPRKAGEKESTRNGKRSTTNSAGTSQTTKTNTTAANTSVVNTPVVSNTTANAPLSEEQLIRNAIIREHGTEGLKISNTTYDGGVLPTLLVGAPAPKTARQTQNNTPYNGGILPELIVTAAIPKIVPQQNYNTNVAIQSPQELNRKGVNFTDLGTIGPAGKEQKRLDWG